MERPTKSTERPVQRLYPNLDGITFDMANESVIVSAASNLRFESGSLDYTAAEFYDIFRKELPCLVVVDQGFCGDIIEDTFDKDQVILLNTVSTQRRVVGRMGDKEYTKWISIPWNYHEMLRVVDIEKVWKPKPLAVILDETRLPCKVMFPEKTTSTVGSAARRSNDRPIVELTNEFDEVYFLGHFVNYGELAINIITVPLYLSQLKIKLIKGFLGKPSHEFDSFMKKMILATRFLNYDFPCGNKNIAEYDSLVVLTGKTFPLIQPNIYADMMTIASRKTPMHRPQPTAPTSTIRSGHQRYNNPPLQNTSTTRAQKTLLPLNATAPQGARWLNEHTTSRRPPPDRPLPPLPHEKQGNPVLPMNEISINELKLNDGFTLLAETFGKSNPHHAAPAVSADVKKTSSPSPHLTGSEGIKKPPRPLPRGISEIKNSRRPPPPEPDPDYGTEQEITEESKDQQPTSSKQIHDSSEVGDKTTSKLIPNAHRSAFRVNVRALAIDGVCEYLIKLHLHQFQKVFRDNMIDGNMLIELDSDMLTTYMGMNRIEALRLVKFAESGMIPS